jgi:solute carrier family 35, member E3
MFWVGLSSLFAFMVNLSIFLVIGKTSAVSYNVLGHAKLCCILVSGYVVFQEPATAKNIAVRLT